MAGGLLLPGNATASDVLSGVTFSSGVAGFNQNGILLQPWLRDMCPIFTSSSVPAGNALNAMGGDTIIIPVAAGSSGISVTTSSGSTSSWTQIIQENYSSGQSNAGIFMATVTMTGTIGIEVSTTNSYGLGAVAYALPGNHSSLGSNSTGINSNQISTSVSITSTANYGFLAANINGVAENSSGELTPQNGRRLDFGNAGNPALGAEFPGYVVSNGDNIGFPTVGLIKGPFSSGSYTAEFLPPYGLSTMAIAAAFFS